MVGFVLTDNRRGIDGGIHVLGYHLSTGYYTLLQDVRVSKGIGSENNRHFLPAGTYSLYLFASSGTVTVTLPFENRPGAETLTTTRSVAARVEVLGNRIPEPAGSNQWNAGSMGESGSLGTTGLIALSFAASWMLGVDPGAGEICFYHGIPSDEDTAFMPGCPASYLDDFQGFETIGWPGSQVLVYQSEGGDRAAGIWWAKSNPTFRVGAVEVFVPYEAAAPGDGPDEAGAVPPFGSGSNAGPQAQTFST